MAKTTIPTDPDQRFKEFIEKSEALEGEKITAAIPREYMQPSVARGFAGLAVSLAVYIGAIVAMALRRSVVSGPATACRRRLGRLGSALHCP